MPDTDGNWTEAEVAEEAGACSAQQQYLCVVYRLTGDLTEAAARAGYVTRHSATEALRRKHVGDYLQRLRTTDLRLAAERLALRLEWITDATVYDALEDDEQGGFRPRKPSEMTRAERYGLRKITMEPRDMRGGIRAHKVTVEVRDVLPAMKISVELQELLARWAAQPHPETDVGATETPVFAGSIPMMGRELEVERYMLGSGVPQELARRADDDDDDAERAAQELSK